MSATKAIQEWARTANLADLLAAERGLACKIGTEKNAMIRSSLKVQLRMVKSAIGQRTGMPAATQANCNASTGM